MFVSEKRRKLLEAQKDFHCLLGPDAIKLCEMLQLSDAAKRFVQIILDYVINSHIIDRESTMLQAFQLALCWTAASLLKQKVSHKKSLACAKKHLNFNCKKDDVDYVYAMLQCLKSRLLYCTSCRYPSENPSNSIVCSSEKITSEIGGLSPDQENTARKDVSKSIKQIQKKFKKKSKKLDDKHRKERSELLTNYKEETENLEFKHKIESIVIDNCLWRNMWEAEQQKEVEDRKHQVKRRLEYLKNLQLEAAKKLKEKEKIWVEELKTWAHDELFYKPSVDAPESAHGTTTREVMVPSQTAEHGTTKAVACSGHITAIAPAHPTSAGSALEPASSVAGLFTDVMSRRYSENSSHDQENFVSVTSGAKGLINIGGTSDRVEVLLDVTGNVCSISAEAVTPNFHSLDNCTHNTKPLTVASAAVSLEVAETVKSANGPQRPLLLDPTSVEHNPFSEGLHETVRTRRDLYNVVSEIVASGEEPVHVLSVATMQDNEVETGGHDMWDIDLEDLVALDLPQMLKSARGKVKNDVQETISLGHDFHNGIPVIPPLSLEENPVMSLPTMLDNVAEAGVLNKESNDYVSLGEDQGNLVSMHSSSFNNQILVSTSGQYNSEVDSSVYRNSYQKMTLESLPTVHPLIALVLGCPLKSHQEDQDQGTYMATSSATQDGDAEVLQIPMQFDGSLPFNCHLLQQELERLEKEREEILKSHEANNLQLKSDMEKGMEELKAEICQEYETKLQQIEAEFILKKEDMVATHKNLLCHMLLSCAWDAAFKSNVMNNTGSSSSGVNHDGNYTVYWQLVWSYMQQNAQMPFSVSGSSSANPPAARRQSTPFPLATIPNYSAPVSQSIGCLPTPRVRSTNPASYSHISSVSSLTRRPQGRVEIQAPLQQQEPSIPFSRELFLSQEPTSTQIPVPYNRLHDHGNAGEPSLSVTATSPAYQQCEIISNQQQSTTTTSSPPSVHHPTQRPLLRSHQFVPNNMVNPREPAALLPALRSASALELLIETSYPSSRTWRSARNGSRIESSGGSIDIVCLSDDE